MSETTTARAEPGGRPREQTPRSTWWDTLSSARGAFWTYIGVLVVGAFTILWMNRDQWFLTEDWAFFVQNRPRLLSGDWGAFLFEPYRGHWITMTNVLYEAIYRLVGMRSYILYLLPTILGTCACSALIRVHLRRARVEPWLATGIAALALFLAFGAEDVAKAWQLAFTLSLAFGLAQLMMSDHDGPIDRRDAIAVGLGFLAMMTSGIGLLFAGIVALSLGLRRRWKAALVNVAPLLGAYLVWYVAYGHVSTTSERARLGDADTVLDLVWHAISLAMDGLTRLGGTGGVIFLVVVALAIATHVPATQRGTAPAVAMAVGAPAFLLLSATTHLASFAELADRYLHVSELLLLPLIGVVLSRMLHRSRVLVAVGAGVLAVLVVANGIALSDRVDGYTRVNAILKPKVLAMASLPDLESFPRNAVSSEPLLFLVTVGAVERLERDGAFGSISSSSAKEQEKTRADLGLRLVPVTRKRARPNAANPAALLTPLRASVARTEPGCLTVDTTSSPQGLTLGVASPTILTLKTSASGQFVIRVEGSSIPDTQVRLLALERGRYELHVDLRDVALELELPGRGSTLLCGVGT